MNLAIDTFPAERFGLITGSRCTPLFPVRDAEKGQRTLARELANEMFFQFYDEFGNKDTEHGTMAEAFAFEHFQEHHDTSIEKGRWIRKGDCGGSTDAELSDYGVDFKCPTKLSKWLEYVYNGVSSEQVNQCQMYMYLTGKDKWVIAAYLQETQWMSDNGLRYPVPENKRMILKEVFKSIEWQDKLHVAVPRVIEWRNENLEILKLQFKDINLVSQ